MNTRLTVVATFTARPGKEAKLRSALLGLLEPTRKEAGCLNYDFHESVENPAKFLFHENWASKAHLDAHLQSSHIQVLLPRVGELCTGFPEITLWNQVETDSV
ncbi:MAG: antibiotic biosynthesis monooxygenase [Akkermansiaceae bacterium]|nr:antibiotic biosynthesis monooxygenase [Verrucomicrobiales bacterium]